jgi:hypothetical protein
MRFLRSALLAALLALASILPAQQSSPPQLTPEQEEAAAKAQQLGDVMAVVKKQFGPDLKIAETPTDISTPYLHPDPKKDAGWRYLITGDLNGDGIEDAVIVVRFKNPLAGQTQYDYKVIDPYFAYYGYGNPKVTVAFQSEDPRYNNMILVIHGAGKEGWHADTTKEKFVIINLPFERLNVAPVITKKKQKQKVKLMGIQAIEPAGASSCVYWDGKKYQWIDTGGGTG